MESHRVDPRGQQAAFPVLGVFPAARSCGPLRTRAEWKQAAARLEGHRHQADAMAHCSVLRQSAPKVLWA